LGFNKKKEITITNHTSRKDNKMKRMMYIYAILAVGFINLGLAQDINGKWKGQMQSPEGAMDIIFNFKVSADTLTGSVESPMGELPFSNGKVKDNTFSFDVSFNEMAISHQCTILADSISMKFSGMDGETREIILKRLSKTKE
jgi:hypothetical protein